MDKKHVHTCNKEADIEVIKTHVVYIKEAIDLIKKRAYDDKKEYVSKREINIHRWVLGAVWTAIGTIYVLIIGR